MKLCRDERFEFCVEKKRGFRVQIIYFKFFCCERVNKQQV